MIINGIVISYNGIKNYFIIEKVFVSNQSQFQY